MINVQANEFLKTVFLAVLALMGVGCIAALIYCVISKRFADKLAAINLIIMLSINAVCMLAVYFAQDYVLDIAMIYTLLSFTAIVVLTKIHTERNGGGKEK